MGSANYIYSLTTVAAFLRCEKVASDLTQTLLKNLSLTFRTDSDPSRANDGEYLYRVFSSDSNLKTINGFTNEQWNNLESLIEGNQQSKIGISSLIYCFSTYTNIDNKYKKYYINKLYSIIYDGKPPKTFESPEIENLISVFNISIVNSEIKQSEVKQEYRVVNYNYYNALPLFANLETNLKLKQTVKDSENQYYYISGKLSYEPSLSLTECEKDEIIISTSTGDIVSTVYRSFPCFEKESFVGPVSGIEFFRIFNDGPPSSGYFESDTLQDYIKFDENISEVEDYSSNKKILYSFTRDKSGNYVLLKSGVQVDSQGPFSSTGEYGYYHTNFIYSDEGCDWEKEELESLPLMRMHQGDNAPKYVYSKIKIGGSCETGVSGPFNWTGFKFVNFKLNNSWSDYFNYIRINPRDEDHSRILKRALNIENFYDSEDSIIHSPYLDVVDTGDGVLFCSNYVGYPQLNSDYSSLPGFAFYQTFDNKNFGTGNSEEFSTISIHPAISSGLSSITNSKSNRNLVVSDFPLFSGKKTFHENKSKLPINITLGSSSIGNYDEVFKKVVSIGDNFNNQVSGESSLQLNAGYLYTGYTLFKDGEIVNLSSLIQEYEDKKVGAEYSKVKYITGYLNTGTNIVYPVIALTAHIASGDAKEIKKPGEYKVYYYFNTDTGENSLYSVNTGWTENFAPIPTGINNGDFSGLYGYQKVENYFPRYWSGPYATYENKFLYPNAKYIYEKYNSFRYGFPYKISYKINIREETVREFALVSGFNSYSYEKIVRAGSGGVLTGLEVGMSSPFIPNTSNQIIKNKYDFYKNKSFYPFPSEMDSFGFSYSHSLDKKYVNSFYVPISDYWLNDNINSEEYKYGSPPNFVNGIKVKKQAKSKKIKVNKNNQIVDSTGLFFTPSADGLYWAYKGTKITGEMLYCPPLFDLSLLRKNVTEELKKKFLFPIVEDQNVNNIKDQDDIEDSPIFSNNGLVDDAFFNPYEGIDPIFGEYVGGRIGSGAELEGGYHSKDIIGDSWYNFHKEFVGKKQIGQNQYVRNAINDLNFFLLSMDSGDLNIYTRSLNYYPFYHNLDYKPFINSTLANIGVNTKSLKIKNNEYYFTFDLQERFPLKNITDINGEFYSSSGLKIGPFDRDVELCVLKGNSILPSGNIVIDDIFIAGSQVPINYKNIWYETQNISTQVNNFLNLFPLSSGIIPGLGRRNENITTFKLIPSGKIVEINLSGTGVGKLGFEKSAIVTIRPRTFFKDIKPGPDNINGISSSLLSGDPCYLNVYNFVNNGTEQKISFSHNGDFKNLIGKRIDYITNPRFEFLFPEPDQSDFEQVLASKNLIAYDSFGNKTYQGTRGPTYDYWKIKNPNLQTTGIRESSRISIEIESIDLEYGHSPYQSEKIIIPSGFCNLSGIFAYTGQAESSILSQGLFLTGLVRPSVLDPYYSPHYVSDVLKRLPREIQELPSGSGKFPVLDAPSYVKKRKNYFDLDLAKLEYENYSPPGYNYNKFYWPASSDLAELNPDVVYERLPPEDDNTFTNSYLFFSASKGQVFFEGGSGFQNPIENVTYKTQYLYAFIDSTATNSSYNTGKCIIKVVGEIDTLDTGSLTGILAIENTTIGLNKNF